MHNRPFACLRNRMHQVEALALSDNRPPTRRNLSAELCPHHPFILIIFRRIAGKGLIFNDNNLTGVADYAANVTVRDALPAGLSYHSHVASTGSFNSTALVWDIGTLAKGASATLELTVTGIASGTQTNTAQIGTSNLDEVPGNNTSSANVEVLGMDHYEIDIPVVGLTCQPSNITVRACANSTAPCTSNLATSSTSTTLSASSGSFTNPGGATQSFIGSTSYTLATDTPTNVTIGLTSPANTTPKCFALSGNTRTLLASCSFQVKTAAFIFSVPDFSAGDGSGNITISAQQEDDATKKCVSFTPSGNVKMWTDYINPATGTKQATLTHGSDYTLPSSPPGSGNVPLVFNSSGQASISLNYWDAGKLRLNAEWNQVTGYSDFVVKPYFVISDLTCSDLTANPAANGPGGAKFCRAGDSFSATVKAVAANRTTTTPNFGRETPAESVKLTTALVSPVGGENPALLGSLAKDAGDPSVARSTSLSWGEVGIISLTPGIDDGDYLGAGNVTADAVARVGRFYPHHFATATTPPMECPGTAPAFVCPASNGTPASGMAYAGQTFTASITARNASGGTTQNYDKDTGYANASGLAAYTAKGGAVIPSGAASGSLSGSAATASDFIKGKATLSTAKYTFTTPPGTASDIYLRASETSGDAVTSLRNPSSDSVEGGLKIAQGRLRLINAFGNGKQPLKMQAEAQFWSGTSWVKNNKDSTALTQSAIIVSDPAKLSISNFTFSNGSGEITLTATTAGSYDVSANLGATGAALASCTSGLSGGTAANVPWLRSRNGTCTASDSFAADPTARATFGVYAPETKKTIHVREFY
jgi:MSHA biogenesis protein MshQ